MDDHRGDRVVARGLGVQVPEAAQRVLVQRAEGEQVHVAADAKRPEVQPGAQHREGEDPEGYVAEREAEEVPSAPGEGLEAVPRPRPPPSP